MAGDTYGLPLVQPGTIAGSAVSPIPYQHMTGREQIVTDTEIAGGASPQSVAARSFQVAALSAAFFSNRATLASNVGTLATTTGCILTEALTTAPNVTQAFTVTNSLVTATSDIMIDVHSGTNQYGPAAVVSIAPAAGSFVAIIQNQGTVALNGTLLLPFRL